MEEGSSNASSSSSQMIAAAPFVLKTYRMVNDPATDSIICWGRESNSFVVADPFAFSRSLLPAHFKHSNFSSFVRQLNTYGFRKVDPDRWEFAHTSFLKGQTHLLRWIVRRNSGTSGSGSHSGIGSSQKIKEEEAGVDDSVVYEVLKLKQEQRSIDEKVDLMWRRLQETEKRPKQMLAFLVKMVSDPQLLQRLMARSAAEEENAGKRARLRLEEPKLELEEGIDMLALDCEDLVGGAGLDEFNADHFVPTSDSAVDPMALYGGDDMGGIGDVHWGQ